MAIIPTTFDLTELGAYDISKLRADFLRAGGVGYPGGLFEGAITGDESMVQDGSTDPVIYGWGPDDTAERWALMGFNALISDGATAFDGVHFGETGPCNNGVIIRINRRGTSVIQAFDTILANPDWAHLAGEKVEVLPFGKADDCMLVSVDFRGPETLILDGANGDVLEVVIQDDLTLLTAFNVYAWGYKI
jgi:hypothetical protein